MHKTAVFAGSLDPLTFGHEHLIRQGVSIFDKLFVVIGYNPQKKGFFVPEERVTLCDRVLKAQLAPEDYARIEIVPVHDELLVNFASSVGAQYIIRGLRSAIDFDKEYQMCQINREIDSEIETMYLIPPLKYAQISSSTVRELALFKGSHETLKKFVHPIVLEAVLAKTEASKK